MTSIPPSLFVAFFRDATKSLNECELGPDETCVVRSLSDIRKTLLQAQVTCLARVVSDYDAVTVEQVQHALKDLGSSKHVDTQVKEAMDGMNDAARLAFCRLVLREECQWDTTAKAAAPRTLTHNTPMERSDLVEYAGLCNGVVRLPSVKKHLRDGSRLFDDIDPTSPASIFPQKRLERIQQQLLRAIGFDIEFGTQEIKRYFTSDALDPELAHVLSQFSSNMTVAITNASMESTEVALSDLENGGVTRVVSVNYSEKIISSDGQEMSSTGAPVGETIVEQSEEQQLAHLQMARDAAALEQSILGNLLSLTEEDRAAQLEVAKNAHEDFMRRAMSLPVGQERISFLTSVDPETQRLLVMHKIWTKMLAENDGKPPVMRQFH